MPSRMHTQPRICNIIVCDMFPCSPRANCETLKNATRKCHYLPLVVADRSFFALWALMQRAQDLARGMEVNRVA
jgi:hypothetical protein